MFRNQHIRRKGDSPGAQPILSTYRPLVSGQVDSGLYTRPANKNIHDKLKREPKW